MAPLRSMLLGVPMRSTEGTCLLRFFGGALGMEGGSGSMHGRPPTHARPWRAAGRDRPPGRMPGPRRA